MVDFWIWPKLMEVCDSFVCCGFCGLCDISWLGGSLGGDCSAGCARRVQENWSFLTACAVALFFYLFL